MTVSAFPRISSHLARYACLIILTLAAFIAPAEAVIGNGANAIDILGQFDSQTSDASPDYTKSCMNSGASAIGFGGGPVWGGLYTAMDSTHHLLFVSDTPNSRVLVFSLTSGNAISSKTPIHVLGQSTFYGCMSPPIGMTQSTMVPGPLAIDAAGQRLFVADQAWANRVLVFNTSSIADGMNASYVLGQSDFSANNCPDPPDDTTVCGITGLAFDSVHNRLFVDDGYGYDRILVFNTSSITNGMAASYELGQTDFAGENWWNRTQSGFAEPQQIAYDGTHDKLYVADKNNGRVLQFDTSTITNGMNASHVLGEPDFTTDNNDYSQTGMQSPFGVAVDEANKRLFVLDGSHALEYNINSISNGMAAEHVLGESDFTSYQTSAIEQGKWGYYPYSLMFDASNNLLYVNDQGNNRSMIFDTSSITDGENATDLLGQYDSQTSTTNNVYIKPYPANGPNSLGMSGPECVTMDRVHHRLFVCDAWNQRVLVYNLNTDNSFSSRIASHVLGQPSLLAGNTVWQNYYGTNMASQIWEPRALAYDPVNDRLFVADFANDWSRVLVFNTSSITDGMDASYVLGEPNLTSFAYTYLNGYAASAASIWYPQGLAIDTANHRLFVADGGHNRVLVFDTSAISSGMNASYVLGQSNFTNSNASSYSTGMNWPTSVAYDPSHQRLFVSEGNNHRVLEFNLTSLSNGMAAEHVLGQTGYGAAHVSSGLSQSRMNSPYGLSFDSNSGRLFVSDLGNGRVLVFNTSFIANGMNASYVLGAPDLTSGGWGDSNWQGSFNHPFTPYYDMGTGRLFVPDNYHARVMVFDATAPMGDWQLP